MALEGWVALTLAYCLGAMSPGPSLALVIRNTLRAGRTGGLVTGLGHGLGFGIYATIAAFGLAAALAAHPLTDIVLRWGGTALLLYLSVQFLRAAWAGPTQEHSNSEHIKAGHQNAFVEGFGVSILNPKILAWMLAVYAPLIDADAPWQTLMAMGALGLIIDTGWYMTAAVLMTRGNGLARLRAHAHRINGAMGVLMLAFAVALLFGA